MAFAHPEFLVSTQWLAEHLADDDVRVFETTVFLHSVEGGGRRAESGRSAYETGHIPGAGFLDLQADFSDNDQPYRFMMPAAAAFAEAAGRHGISDTAALVLYDRLGSQWAARFWWMFRSMGCRGAMVLDGGLRRWTAEGRAVSTNPTTYAPAVFQPHARPGALCRSCGGAGVHRERRRRRKLPDQRLGPGSALRRRRRQRLREGRAHPRRDQRAVGRTDRPRNRPLPAGRRTGIALCRGRRGSIATGGHLLRRRHRGLQRRFHTRHAGLQRTSPCTTPPCRSTPPTRRCRW